jgi:23S rRNA pseudouridine2605 synthase
MDNDKDGQRLNAYLAQSGLGSRRSCEKLIEEGHITVNGSYILTQGFKVQSDDEVKYNGKLVKPMQRKIYIVLHKPSGYICSNQDERGRPLAKDLFESAVPQRVFNVGRLDYMTSGIIFFTNDGDFALAMTHPSCSLEKEYEITTKKEIPKELMESFKKGIYVLGEHFRCSDYEIISTHRVRIILKEGKNRELRKVFQSKNISIKKVHRLRIGRVTLQGLTPGRFRHLKDSEIQWLMEAAGKKYEKKNGKSRSTKRSGK